MCIPTPTHNTRNKYFFKKMKTGNLKHAVCVLVLLLRQGFRVSQCSLSLLDAGIKAYTTMSHMLLVFIETELHCVALADLQSTM